MKECLLSDDHAGECVFEPTSDRIPTKNPGWINTASGIRFQPLNPNPADIKLEDIAASLCKVSRYVGHTSVPYSVAEHSVLVAEAVRFLGGSLQDQRAALLHDATEAYLSDIAGPIKSDPIFAGYRVAEERLWLAVAKRFGLDPKMPQIVEHVDKAMIGIEASRLFKARHPDWKNPVDDPQLVKFFSGIRGVFGLVWIEAQRQFLEKAQELDLS